MRERTFCLGSHGGIVGVVCEPDVDRPGAPAALFSNVGLNHRVGPNRAWVETARALAERGFASLRFDLSGLGDSAPRPDGRSEQDRAILDTREAMDFLSARLRTERFVLMANCSGVDSLHATSLVDPRVVGVVSIDGYVYRDRAYAIRRALLRLLQPSRWQRHRRLRRIDRFDPLQRQTGGVQEVWKRDLPSRERFAADLAALVARQVALLFVYTSGVDSYYNQRGQFHNMFGYRREASVLFFPRADHLFSRQADRRDLTAAICAWMDARFARS